MKNSLSIFLHTPSSYSLKAMAPLVVRSPCCETSVSAAENEEEDEDLGKEPHPATALLGGRLLSSTASGGGLSSGLSRVEVLGVDRDDVVVVAELASFSTEAKVGNLRDRRRLVGFEAERPLALALVLELQLDVLLLEISQAELGRDGGMPDAPRRAAGKFGALSIGILVVRSLAVANHSHDVGEHDARPVVLVRVEEDSQTLKEVNAAKHRAGLGALLGEPHGETVTIELVLAVNLEFHLDFPVGGRQWHSRKEPTGLRRMV